MVSLSMRTTFIIVAGMVVVMVLVATMVMLRRTRRQARFAKFKDRWQAVQHQCAKSETWPLAVLDADKLVDEALKLAGFHGRTMGERLVSAQRTLTDNDGVWFGHKLRNKIAHEEMSRLYKKDVQAALRGMRQALQDLGAL